LKSSYINILFIADIIGRPGFEIVEKHIHTLFHKYSIDLVIANGENGTVGKGLTAKVVQLYFELGINVITSGNHIWNRNKLFPLLETEPNLLRPLNYPPECPGHGSCVVELQSDSNVGIINLQGRSFMYSIDCPFRTVDLEIKRLKSEGIKIIIIDFHAEATAEKIALGWYLDGRVSAVIGTHTHVQTADERILPNGTAYITDVGMTGPFDSVIGMDKEVSINRFIKQIPQPYKIAQDDLKFCGLLLTINKDTGKAHSISRLQLC
jgi:metallophosphoesterase (TIGR00282 family)